VKGVFTNIEHITSEQSMKLSARVYPGLAVAIGAFSLSGCAGMADKDAPPPSVQSTVNARPCIRNAIEDGSIFSGKKVSTYDVFAGYSKTSAMDLVLKRLAQQGWAVSNVNREAGVMTVTRAADAGRGKTYPTSIIVESSPAGSKVTITTQFGMGMWTPTGPLMEEYCTIISAPASHVSLPTQQVPASDGERSTTRLMPGAKVVTSDSLVMDQDKAGQAAYLKRVSAVLIREVQSALRARGEFSGRIDGLDGPQTRRAIMQYQKASGLTPDGVASQELLVRLRGSK
jgi:hypothetical protein